LTSAYISEIYPTIQGEGPYTGERQLFLRLAGCPLRCNYCDTPDSLMVNGTPSRNTEEILHQVLTMCRNETIDTVSITGGEPLSQIHFLKTLLPLFRQNQLRTYLETAGVHPEALIEIVDFCDVIAMDLKMPSATGRRFWDEHRRFLEIGKDKIFVKVVIEQKTQLDEIKIATSLLMNIENPPLLVLQPVTPQANGIMAPSQEKMNNILAYTRSRLPRVHIMPQQHKIWAFR